MTENQSWTPQRLWGHKGFRNLFLAQAISDFGDGLTGLGLLIMVNNLTGSTAALATMAIVLAVPQVTLGLLAGVYVDRFDRKRIMLVSDALRALLVLGFVFINSAEQLWLLYLLGFLQSAVGTFFMPARGAVMAQLLPPQALLMANSMAQTSRIVAGLVGASAAGIIIGTTQTYWPVYLTDALTFALSFLLVWWVQVPKAAAGATQLPSGVGASLRQGLGVIFGSRLLLGTLTGAAVLMLGLGAVNVLFVPLLTNDLKVPTTLFGLVQGAQTAGIVLAGAVVALLSAKLKPTQLLSLGMVGLGVAIGLIAVVSSLPQVLVVLFVVGLLVAPIQAGTGTLVQTAVSNEVRGRVGAALNAVIGSSNLLSMGLAGFLAGVIGVREVFLVAGGMAVLAGLASYAVFAGATPAVSTRGNP